MAANLRARLAALVRAADRTVTASGGACVHIYRHAGDCVPGAPFDHAQVVASIAPDAEADRVTIMLPDNGRDPAEFFPQG